MLIGLTLREYNECTPYELGVMIKQHAKREKDSIEKIRIQAWLIAKLTTPKVPNYNKVFKDADKVSEDVQHEGIEKNKMHKKQIERHLKEFKEGGLRNGRKFGNSRR